MKKIKKLFSKNIINYINQSKYIKYYKKYKVRENVILLDSQHGNNFSGNIFYIAKELNEKEYINYDIYVSVNSNNYDKFAKLIENYNLNRIKLIKMQTKMYYKIVSFAKYIISDTSMLPFFIKKDDQIYLNVWHGTPLKCLGKSTKTGYHLIGNIQKNFFVANYLLYPNEYMMNHMIKDYMLENISDSKILLCGYPRNTSFFDNKSRNEIRKKFNFENKQVIAYMPTWRDNRSLKEEIEFTTNFLCEIDKKLSKNQIMYVNLHPFVSDKIEYNFKHIFKFPNNYETYDFLNASDILITDYSSVFFDYANTKRKIILYNYDEYEYLQSRGCYISLDELPFVKVQTIDNLIREVNNKKVVDYTEFLNKFCKYDSINSTKELCEKVILNKENNIVVRNIQKNNKENILIFGGKLLKNGITTSLLNLLNNVDPNKYNYYLTFPGSDSTKYENVKKIPDYIGYIPTLGKANETIFEKICVYMYLLGIFPKLIEKNVLRVYENEIKRQFGNIKFKCSIQFTGYGAKNILLFSKFKNKKVIFVHSDIKDEVEIKKNQKRHIINYAYNNYDNIAIVNDTLLDSVSYFTKDKSKIILTENYIDYNHVINNSSKEIIFDEDTKCNVSLNELNKILNNKNNNKFINVGRYSFEKGQKRLIDCFDKIYEKYKNNYLIIIGGYGNIYDELLEYAQTKKSYKNIIMIYSMSNPFPVLKKCDCFVLSSFYEGFGLCLIEADILGLKVFSTDIVGPKSFMKKNKGLLVENSELGIYKGMEKFLNNEIEKMNIDYDKYNKIVLKEFNNMLK